MYGPILLRERSAATMCRFWRCARSKQAAQRRRWSNALAARVNPLVRGFLARRATEKVFEERYRRNCAILVVSEREREGRVQLTACARQTKRLLGQPRFRRSFDKDRTSNDPPVCFRHQRPEIWFYYCVPLSRVSPLLRPRQKICVKVCVATQKMFRGKQGRLKARRKLLRKCAAVDVRVFPVLFFRRAGRVEART